jgi:hypothetical protein
MPPVVTTSHVPFLHPTTRIQKHHHKHTRRSWCFSERSKRRTLQKEDIQAAIANTDILDFLVNIV